MAKDYIPKQKWYKTPLVLKATAGLRLLPGNKAENILEGVKKLFMGNLFQKLGDDFVSLMDGDSEGIYGWLTVNYLSEKLKPLEVNKMYGALDLGGGSVQITLPMDDKQIEENQVPSNYIKSIDVSLNSYTLYTHSYLGLGLMSARAAILNASATHQEDSKKVISVSSPCFPVGYKDVWKFAGYDFEIKGTDQCSFENCQDFAKSVVMAKGINRAAKVNNVNIFAFSYFFDRATDLSLIDENSGGEIMVQNYVDAAQTVCQRGSVTEKPFLCLDTTYISTLLTDGFGLGLHHRLMLKRNINDFDVSWAVGAALDLYEQARKMSHN
ncbi:ectonucleoside triphosphate diphosphohydrolase 5-like isoform X2 [Rhopilema esculentum]